MTNVLLFPSILNVLKFKTEGNRKIYTFDELIYLRLPPNSFLMKTHLLYRSILIRALHVCSVLLVCVSTQAASAKYGYRVTSSKTVIQIARDVYSDERVWKKIAYWNNLKPPYSLHKGQILVLPSAPVNSLPEGNAVAENEVPEPKFLAKRPSVDQKVESQNPEYIYHVSERAPSLNMVALDVYGNKKMAPLIAKWNRLSMDSKLSLGQKLVLKVEPKMSLENSNTTLADYWIHLGNKEMAERILGREFAGPIQNAARKTAAQTPTARATKTTSKTKTQPMNKAEPATKPAVNPIVEKTVETQAPVQKSMSRDLPEKPVISNQPIEPIVEKTESEKFVDPELEQEKNSAQTQEHVHKQAPTKAPVTTQQLTEPAPQAVAPKVNFTPALPQGSAPSNNATTTPSTVAPVGATSPNSVPAPTAQTAPAQATQQKTVPQKPAEASTTSQQTPANAAGTSSALPKATAPAPAAANPDTAQTEKPKTQEKEPTTESYWLGEDTHTIYRSISNEPKH